MHTSINKAPNPLHYALLVSAIFLVFSVFWILLTDLLLEHYVRETATLTRVQTIKGLIFVSGVSIFIGILTHRFLRKINDSWKETQRREIQRAILDTEAANTAKDEFLAVMSHEMRTPLNPIMGYTELLLQQHIHHEPEREYLEEIAMASQRMLHLVDNILYYAKISTTGWESRLNLFHLYDFCQRLLNSLKSSENHFNLLLDWPDSDTDALLLPKETEVVTDEYILWRILEHLLKNACKFTTDGHVTLKVRVLRREGSRSHFQFSVEDTGTGIDAKFLPKIFQAFTQEDSSNRRKHQGLGLGLSICHKLSTILNGELDVSSEIGKGSTFRLEVELKTHIDHKGTTISKQRLPLQLTRIHPHILIVEDQPSNSLFADTVLKKAGARTKIARDGVEAIELCQQEAFDLILMDLNIPKMDGFETTKKIRSEIELNKNTPVIALTANNTVEAKELCLKSGMQGFISKPVQVRIMEQEINRHLGT